MGMGERWLPHWIHRDLPAATDLLAGRQTEHYWVLGRNELRQSELVPSLGRADTVVDYHHPYGILVP